MNPEPLPNSNAPAAGGDGLALADPPAAGLNRRRRWTGRFPPALLVGMVMAASVTLVAVFAPVIAHYSPTQITQDLLARPTAAHIFGTDRLGRDVFSRVVTASQVSLGVALLASVAALSMGTAMGVSAGYLGAWLDTVITRILDLLLAFPPILFAIALVAALGPSTQNLILTLAILFSPRFARLARGSTLSVKERDYIASAKALGASRLRIIRVHILPNIAAPLIVEMSLTMSIALLTEAALSFLGLGIQPPQPSWGGMISSARPTMIEAPWAALFPGLAIMFSVLAFNFLGDGLREVFDPRLRQL